MKTFSQLLKEIKLNETNYQRQLTYDSTLNLISNGSDNIKGELKEILNDYKKKLQPPQNYFDQNWTPELPDVYLKFFDRLFYCVEHLNKELRLDLDKVKQFIYQDTSKSDIANLKSFASKRFTNDYQQKHYEGNIRIHGKNSAETLYLELEEFYKVFQFFYDKQQQVFYDAILGSPIAEPFHETSNLSTLSRYIMDSIRNIRADQKTTANNQRRMFVKMFSPEWQYDFYG